MTELLPEVLAALYDESPEPVFVFVPVWTEARVTDFRFLYSNPVAARAVGREAGETRGRSLREAAPDAERSGLLARYCRTMETGEPTAGLIHYDDGRVRGWFRIHASRAGAALLVHFRDVTQETETAAALQKTEVERDETEQRRAALESLLARVEALAQEKAALVEALEAERNRLVASEERLRSMVETHADIVWVSDWDGSMRHVTPAWCALTGQEPEAMLGLGWIDCIHPDDLGRTSEIWLDAVTRRSRFQAEYRLRRADGSWAAVVSRGVPLLRPDGKIREWVGTTIDISGREREEQALRILSGGAAELSGTLDYAATLKTVAAMAVPALADVCVVDLVDESGQLRRVEVAGSIEEDLLQRFRTTPPRSDPHSPVVEALRSRRSVLRERLPEAVREELAGDPQRLALYDRLSPTSLVCAPLAARGRTLGVISFLSVRRGRHYDPLDVGLVEELARRAALALDNAELYQRAEEASRAKDEFLATVSHELRTPLAAILGWIRLLRRGGLGPEKQARALETLERNARAQSRLVEDLLDVGRIVSGKTRLEIETSDLARIVEAALESVRPAAETRSVQLQAALQPCTVSGDPQRLHQVLWNLLSNALKFTPAGGRVSVTLERREPWAVLTMTDTGQGIRPDFLPHVFERFRQADATVTRAHGGLGLGLAIVRHLVELHGGTVRASSPGEGRGATFTIELPLAAASIWNPPPLHASVPGPGEQELSGLRILVVEDEADTREMIASALEAQGAEVLSLDDAEQALAVATSERLDVLVSDVAMPRLDGHALIRALRRLRPDSSAAIPAVALSAFARPDDRACALEAGFQDYLTKPVEPEVLVSVVAALARSRAAA